jgi:hypothetical protein
MFLGALEISGDFWRSLEHLKIVCGLVPTNDFLVVVRITFISCDFLLLFRLLAIAQLRKIRK